MTKEQNFFQRLNNKKNSLTKKQLLIGEYITKNYSEIVFLSCLELANRVNASDATVIRFANVLGYDGFTHMINDLQAQLNYELTYINRLNKFYDASPLKTSHTHDRLNTLINCYEVIADNQHIDNLAKDITKCSNLIIIGSESTSFIVEYLNYHLSRYGVNVDAITNDSGDMFKTYKNIDDKTLLLSISVPRYTKFQYKITCNLIDVGVNTYSITDDISSPYNGLDNKCLVLHSKTDDKFNYLSHLIMLVVAQEILEKIMIYSDKEKLKANMKLSEKYNESFDIFLNKNF